MPSLNLSHCMLYVGVVTVTTTGGISNRWLTSPTSGKSLFLLMGVGTFTTILKAGKQAGSPRTERHPTYAHAAHVVAPALLACTATGREAARHVAVLCNPHDVTHAAPAHAHPPALSYKARAAGTAPCMSALLPVQAAPLPWLVSARTAVWMAPRGCCMWRR